MPESTAFSGNNEHYSGWAADGWLTVTEGEIIDFDEIKTDLMDLASHFEVKELAFDPFQATKLITELMNEGFQCVEMRPTVLNFSEPMKELDAMIRSGALRHDNSPIMTWMMSNVVATTDAKDNVYPRKEREESKIDGAVALIMAVGRYLQNNDNELLSAINNPISAKR